MHASSNIEAVLVIRRNKLRLFPFNDAVDEGSALLLRLRFSPVDRAAIQSDLIKPDRIGHDKIGGDRRTPKTIGTDDHWYHRYYRLPTLAIAQYKLHHVVARHLCWHE